MQRGNRCLAGAPVSARRCRRGRPGRLVRHEARAADAVDGPAAPPRQPEGEGVEEPPPVEDAQAGSRAARRGARVPQPPGHRHATLDGGARRRRDAEPARGACDRHHKFPGRAPGLADGSRRSAPPEGHHPGARRARPQEAEGQALRRTVRARRPIDDGGILQLESGPDGPPAPSGYQDRHAKHREAASLTQRARVIWSRSRPPSSAGRSSAGPPSARCSSSTPSASTRASSR